jgi:pyruvate formate lyase activating enzyme
VREEVALVTNVQRFSLYDGGGIRTVAFLKGCPHRCPWCANPETISYAPEELMHESLCIRCSREGQEPCPRLPDACPTGAKELVGVPTTVGDLLETCLRDRVFFEGGGGVTLSGGEPLSPVHQDFAWAFLDGAKEAGVHTAIETTLGVELPDIERFTGVTDAWLVDFKLADERASRQVSGVSPALRDRNLEAILARGAHVVARMPIIPGYTDAPANVEANVSRLVELGITRADVLPFHQLGQVKYAGTGRPYAMEGASQLSEADVAWVVEALEAASVTACVHGE